MNKNDAFRMGGCVSDRLGNQLAAMECAQEADAQYIERLYQYVKSRCERGLPVADEDLDTLRKAGFIVRQIHR